LSALDFGGGYVDATWFLTVEKRALKAVSTASNASGLLL